MPEPVTIAALATAGLGWVFGEAGGVAGGVIGAAATTAWQSAGRALYDRIHHVPDTEHLARAVRRAQMHALERSLREWWQTLTPQWTAPSADTAAFYKTAIDFCADTLGRCVDLRVKLNAEVTGPLHASRGALLAAPIPGTPSADRAEALAAYAEDCVLAELRERVAPYALPPA